MNYKIIITNSIESSLQKTTNDVDNITVFKSFTTAKKMYLKGLRSARDEWLWAINEALSLKKKDVS